MAEPAKRSTRVTRVDVARPAGTSTAVVSHELDEGNRPAAPATRKRVLAAIAATGDRRRRHTVLTCGAPTTLVPLDVTSGTTLTASDLDRLAEAGTASSDYLVQTSRPWITYCEAVRRRPGCRLHDPLAMAC